MSTRRSNRGQPRPPVEWRSVERWSHAAARATSRRWGPCDRRRKRCKRCTHAHGRVGSSDAMYQMVSSDRAGGAVRRILTACAGLPSRDQCARLMECCVLSFAHGDRASTRIIPSVCSTSVLLTAGISFSIHECLQTLADLFQVLP